MAIVTKQLERTFKFGQITLVDIDPTRSPEAIMEVYSNEHPSLSNGSVKGPTVKNGKAEYEFKVNLGTKG